MYLPAQGASITNLPSAPPATAFISFRESVNNATVGYSMHLPDKESSTTPVNIIF